MNVNPLGGDLVYYSTAVEASKIVSTKRGRVNHVIVYNKTGGTIYLQIFNSATLPADTAACHFAPLPVPAGATGYYDCHLGVPFNAGLVVVASTTDTTKTLAAANCWFTVVYQERS